MTPPPDTTAPAPDPVSSRRLDVLQKVPVLDWLVRRRWFQFALVLPNLLVFVVFLSAGLLGSPVGSHNIVIVFVWIFWWFLLISLLVPFGSRIWCLVCPFPFFGEWLQRRTLVRARGVDPKQRKEGPGVVVGRNRYFGLNLKWPKALSNIWLQNIGFLGLCTFSALFLTRPLVSVIVLSLLFFLATVLPLVYRQRAFCSYVCPVSGFLSLFSMASMAEVRSRSAEVCAKCKDKGCLAGGESGWGCPWFMYPSKLDRNNYCGMCMECMKTCPHENMTVYLRPFCGDTRLKGFDEAWKAFIMLTLAIAYSVIYLGPFGFLKDWANAPESGQWAGFAAYVGGLWASALIIIPSLYAFSVWLGRRISGGGDASFKETFLGFVYPLVPLGLLVWVAFSVPLLMVNGSYVVMALSDPFGWGWNLFGTAHIAWTPFLPHWAPFIQAALLLIGLYFALQTGFAQAQRLFGPTRTAVRAFAPVAMLLMVFDVALMFLYLG